MLVYSLSLSLLWVEQRIRKEKNDLATSNPTEDDLVSMSIN